MTCASTCEEYGYGDDPCADDMSFDGGFGNCTTYGPGRLNEGFCIEDAACEGCGCTCGEECAGNKSSTWYGDDSCEYAFDGVCDEQADMCPAGTDMTDCSYGNGRRNGHSADAEFENISSANFIIGLPDGWGDDQVFRWYVCVGTCAAQHSCPLVDFICAVLREIGRHGRIRENFGAEGEWHWVDDHDGPFSQTESDFVDILRSGSNGEAPANRRVIHPKKHLNLRFPSLADGSFRKPTADTSDFHTAAIKIHVAACDCVTALGCEQYGDAHSCEVLV